MYLGAGWQRVNKNKMKRKKNGNKNVHTKIKMLNCVYLLLVENAIRFVFWKQAHRHKSHVLCRLVAALKKANTFLSFFLFCNRFEEKKKTTTTMEVRKKERSSANVVWMQFYVHLLCFALDDVYFNLYFFSFQFSLQRRFTISLAHPAWRICLWASAQASQPLLSLLLPLDCMRLMQTSL